MSGYKKFMVSIVTISLITFASSTWAGIRFVETPKVTKSKKYWKNLEVNFTVDIDHKDPRSERSRPWEWKIYLRDSESKEMIDDGTELKLPKQNNISIEVPKPEKYKVILEIEFDDRNECERGSCFQIFESEIMHLKPPKPKIYAVIIGIDNYEDESINDLHFPDDDADSVERFLVEVLGVPKNQIKKITANEATRRNIHRTLRKDIGSQLTTEDIVFVYYSGHGFRSVDDFFLVPSNVNPTFEDKKSFNDFDFIPLSDWVRWLKFIAKHVVLIQDSCFSGSVASNQGLTARALSMGFVTSESAFSELPNKWKGHWNNFESSSRYAFLASQHNQKAYEIYIENGEMKFVTLSYPDQHDESRKGHGLFTFAFLYAVEKIIAAKEINIDLNDDKNCGDSPCQINADRVEFNNKKDKIEINLREVYEKLAYFMDQFLNDNRSIMKNESQDPMEYGVTKGKRLKLRHSDYMK